jgi:succinate dehydrogenase cytochrome b556 subunit
LQTIKQGKTVRPISPDLQIWRFSPTAYLHVGVRISGAMLATGMTLTGLYGAVGSCDVPSAIYAIKDAAPMAVPVLKAAVALPLSYHFLGGVRQIYHDFTSKGIDAEFQDKTSYAMAAISGAVTVVAACI